MLGSAGRPIYRVTTERGRTAVHGAQAQPAPKGGDTETLLQTSPTAARFSTSSMEPPSRLSSNQTGKFTIGQHGLPTWDILAPTPARGVRRTGE